MPRADTRSGRGGKPSLTGVGGCATIRGAMADLEGVGVFYLGRAGDAPVLYDSRDLVTHAVVVGMTGSGKTGLMISLLEEAALDGIPALVIDPKGDLGNLLLAFPQLRAEDFAPWVNEDDA